MSALLFALVALRGIFELIFWMLVGRLVLGFLAGPAQAGNVVLRSFDVVLGPPRKLIGRLFPGTMPRDLLLMGVLFLFWLGLGVAKFWLQP